jgi:hypothetical protein
MVRLSWFWFSHVAIFSNLDQFIKTIAFSGKNKIASAPAISAIYLKEDNIFFLHIYSKFKADNCLWRNNVSWWLKWWVNWSRRHCQLNWISDIMMCDDDVCRKILAKDPFQTSHDDERYRNRCWQHISVSRDFVRSLKVRPINK